MHMWWGGCGCKRFCMRGVPAHIPLYGHPALPPGYQVIAYDVLLGQMIIQSQNGQRSELQLLFNLQFQTTSALFFHRSHSRRITKFKTRSKLFIINLTIHNLIQAGAFHHTWLSILGQAFILPVVAGISLLACRISFKRNLHSGSIDVLPTPHMQQVAQRDSPGHSLQKHEYLTILYYSISIARF
ncbi:hypothetical protein F5Y19DRAFT_222853 [Xylariaceae sp. FL1651]|nr:hypothetical protein F5Y19DRAFT_222853 [Xylariaceae sp. FL1651]